MACRTLVMEQVLSTLGWVLRDSRTLTLVHPVLLCLPSPKNEPALLGRRQDARPELRLMRRLPVLGAGRGRPLRLLVRDLLLRDARRALPAPPRPGARRPGHRSARARPCVQPPTWIRLFQLTSGYPWWLPWRHLPRRCHRCRQRVTFAVWTRLAGGRSAYSALCLACGAGHQRVPVAAGRPDARGARLRRRVEPSLRRRLPLRRAVFSPPPAGAVGVGPL
jgi:hypothetical protein